MNIDLLRKEIKNKPNISNKFVTSLLNNVEQHIKLELIKDGKFINVGKIFKPLDIKKFDVITAMVHTIPHPCIVYKVTETNVYAFCMTTKNIECVIHQFKTSRLYKDSYITNTLVTLTKQDALDTFVGIFDARKEAAHCFKLIKTFYQQLLK